MVTEPQAPTKEGYTFLGWYTEGDELYDFSTPITADITLIAKFEENAPEGMKGDLNKRSRLLIVKSLGFLIVFSFF